MRAFDFSWVTLGAGVGAGASLMHQSLDSPGGAPDRLAWVPLLGITASAALPLGGAFFVELGAFGEAHFMAVQDSFEEPPSSRAELSARAALVLGMSY